MKYWIRINRTSHGPHTASEILTKFGPNLPSNTPCAAVGEYKWSTLAELLPEIGLGPPITEGPVVDELSPEQRHLVERVANRAVFMVYAVVLTPIMIPLLYVIQYTDHFIAGVFGLIGFVAIFLFFHIRFEKIAKLNQESTWLEIFFQAIFITRPKAKYANPLTSQTKEKQGPTKR